MVGQFAFAFWNKWSNDTRADQVVTRLTFSRRTLVRQGVSETCYSCRPIKSIYVDYLGEVSSNIPANARVLERSIEHPTAWRDGYELSRETGLN
jgi:hypothetical protein